MMFLSVYRILIYIGGMTSDPEDCINYCEGCKRNDTIWRQRSGCGYYHSDHTKQRRTIKSLKAIHLELRQICDSWLSADLQMIADFLAGQGLFRFNLFDVEPDIICLGKSLGAGFPIAANHHSLIGEGFGPLGEDVHTFQTAVYRRLQDSNNLT